MRLLLLLAASAQPAHGLHGQRNLQATYPACTAAATALFIDNLSAASNGCTDTVSYKWDGDDDPTDAQRSVLCSCTVKPFDVPKCHWTKLKKYDINAAVHFGFAYNCSAISGKATPKVTEVDAASTPVPTTATPKILTPTATTAAPKAPTPTATTAAPKDSSAAADCTAKQLSAFTSALTTASNRCMAITSYNWGGNTNPTNTQYAEICKCTDVSPFVIPDCSVKKGPDKVMLSVHYNWVRSTQCSTFSPPVEEASSNVGLIVGIAAGVVVVVLIIIFFLCKRNRKAQHEQYQPRDDLNAVLSPIGCPPIHATPQTQTGKTNTDSRPSGVSTATHTTTTTGNCSGGYPSNSSGRSTEGGKWDDPVIMAVRIPHDSIFFGSLISRGGFGEVYRGTYKGETVAIKQLLADRRKDLGQIDDFLGEVKLMSSLEHERIVKFIGVAWNSLSDACMVVEFMENGDLRSVLGRWDSGPEKRMNGFDADKMKIALHVAHALVYLHSLNPVVVHRDLKSKNILLDANFDAKLTDFGISRERAESTMTAGVGSALWMAPEVMMGARYDEKADIFSFGVVLSELDTHQLPYFHAKVTESGQKLPEAALLQQVMAGRISVGFTDRANPQLVQLGRECVNVDPKARPTTAQVLHRVHQAVRQ